MKRSILAFFCAASFLAIVSARAQVVPAATGRTFTLNAGGLGSMFQPDYAGNYIAQTSPKRLFGPGVYFDAHFSRWIQIEGEGRWLRFNEHYPCPVTGSCQGVQGIDENTYLIGPRVPIATFHGLTPYGKFLVGLGNANWLTANTFVLSYGGGVDYRLTRRITVRAIDFEYEEWRVNPTLWPYGGSVGISYKIF